MAWASFRDSNTAPDAASVPSPLELPAVETWSGEAAADDRLLALDALEAGRVVLLPRLPFRLSDAERRFLDPACSDGKAKNISYDPVGGESRGIGLTGDARRDLEGLLACFAAQAQGLVAMLFPDYAPHVKVARTSFRPARIDDRAVSFRKDDRLLHADAFPSQPARDWRILRVFSNVNPDGEPRVWNVGEAFPVYAARFLPRTSQPWPGSAWLLHRLGVTKGRRTPYDHCMLQLHDQGKADADFQEQGPRREISFAAGVTWIAFTDCVVHAAIAGQYALEQTLLLPIAAMRDPSRSPLRVLEALTGQSLTDGHGNPPTP